MYYVCRRCKRREYVYRHQKHERWRRRESRNSVQAYLKRLTTVSASGDDQIYRSDITRALGFHDRFERHQAEKGR